MVMKMKIGSTIFCAVLSPKNYSLLFVAATIYYEVELDREKTVLDGKFPRGEKKKISSFECRKFLVKFLSISGFKISPKSTQKIEFLPL